MDFWERTWRERSDALMERFGQTEPPDQVVSYSWTDRVRLPGACALTFPPTLPPYDSGVLRRDEWLYVTQGLTQPLDESEVLSKREKGDPISGRAWEFAFVLNDRAQWPYSALYYILTYMTEGEEIASGDRLPFRFYERDGGELDVMMGMAGPAEPPLVGDVRALLFWPYLFPGGEFCTSTGRFIILVATAITEDEWEFARNTTTEHLLLLLCEAGIVQRTLPMRKSVLKSPQWGGQRRRIEQLSAEEAEEEISRNYDRWHYAKQYSGDP